MVDLSRNLLLAALLACHQAIATPIAGSRSGSSSSSSNLAEEEEDQYFHVPAHRRLTQARIESIKKDILSKLGLSKVPDVSGINVTAAERRKLMKLYTRSLEELHGKTHVIYDDDQLQAKTFHSFTQIHGKTGAEVK